MSRLDGEVNEVDRLPQRRKPLIAGTGWLLFVCAFLPTLRVCSDPIAPYQFPPVYVVHLGALALGVIAVIRVLRARRAFFTAWFVLWFGTAITWAAMILADGSTTASLFVIVAGLAGAVFAAIAFYRQRYTSRGMWIGGIVHGSLSTIWYVLLASDNGAVWGATVGLGSSIAFTVASAIALSRHAADLNAAKLEQERRDNAPAPLPMARLVER
ncbi:MAG: hypothetical protein ACKV2T_17025 [Kofleriaceae bacterium]